MTTYGFAHAKLKNLIFKSKIWQKMKKSTEFYLTIFIRFNQILPIFEILDYGISWGHFWHLKVIFEVTLELLATKKTQ